MPVRPLLTKQQELDLIKKAQAGDTDAENSLLWHHEGFIHLIVKQYTFGFASKYDQDDYLQEGRIGFLQAIRGFDPKKKCRLISYAVWKVRQHLTRYFSNHSRTIRIPVHRVDKINGVVNKFRRVNKEPTVSDFEKALKIGSLNLSVESVLNIFRGCTTIPHPDAIHHRDAVYYDCPGIKEMLEGLGLKPKDLEIMYRFYGAFGFDRQSMTEIGEALNVTAAYVDWRLQDTRVNVRKALREKLMGYSDFFD